MYLQETERRSVLGEKNGRAKRTIVVLLLSTIYNNVLDNDKDNDKKRSSYYNNIPIFAKDLQMKKLQKNYRVQEESSR